MTKMNKIEKNEKRPNDQNVEHVDTPNLCNSVLKIKQPTMQICNHRHQVTFMSDSTQPWRVYAYIQCWPILEVLIDTNTCAVSCASILLELHHTTKYKFAVKYL